MPGGARGDVMVARLAVVVLMLVLVMKVVLVCQVVPAAT